DEGAVAVVAPERIGGPEEEAERAKGGFLSGARGREPGLALALEHELAVVELPRDDHRAIDVEELAHRERGVVGLENFVVPVLERAAAPGVLDDLLPPRP